MELATTLTRQQVRNQVREVGINGNHWYAVCWAREVKPGKIRSVTVWQQNIALYRDRQGVIRGLENICPHKGVALDPGTVAGDHLVCPYHGWEFNSQGDCVRIPYLPPEQKLPCAQVRVFPVQEKYGLVWVFPGDPSLASLSQPLEIPEYNDPDWLMVPITGHFQAHFSICNENSMDVFHGHLHQNLQGWFDPILLKLRETENSVTADYQVSYRGKLSQFLGLSDRGNEITSRVVSVTYCYPHYATSLEGVSALYLMRLPVSAQESRSIAFFFLKVRIPKPILSLLRPVLQPTLVHLVFKRFLHQDMQMMESEQRNYLANPQRRYVEINPAIIAVQRLILRQYELYRQHQTTQSGNLESDSSSTQEASLN